MPDEVAEAARGGYHAGAVYRTTLYNGTSSFDSLVNSAETVQNFRYKGLKYSVVSPPEHSLAGQRFRKQHFGHAEGFQGLGGGGMIDSIALGLVGHMSSKSNPLDS